VGSVKDGHTLGPDCYATDMGLTCACGWKSSRFTGHRTYEEEDAIDDAQRLADALLVLQQFGLTLEPWQLATLNARVIMGDRG